MKIFQPIIILLVLIISMPSCAAWIAGGGIEPSSSSATEVTIVHSGSAQNSQSSATTGSYVPSTGSLTQTPRPTNEPDSGEIPAEPSEASKGSTTRYFFHGQNPSLDELQEIGGAIAPNAEIQYMILYNNQWIQNPAAFWYKDQPNSLLYVNQPQYITYYEKYPDGHVDLNDWGYMSKGYHTAWFSADERGWHRLATWGSESGWSNVVWAYVW